MSDLIGQMVGHSRIEALLGSGGMGQVFRARHSYLGRMEAVKVLHTSLVGEPDFQQRFRQEARATASLRHSQIVRVFDSGEHAGHPYLSMELLPDGSLRTLMQSYAECRQRLPLELSVDLVRQAADGLAWAHTHGIVHRDIKPDNLLLSRSGGRYTLKVGDWGLSVPMGYSGTSATGVVPGTPAYMSPEQCWGMPLDSRSEVYSLGVVLYEMITGNRPFGATTFAQAVHQHAHVAPPLPRYACPTISVPLEAIIMHCLAKTSSDRFQSADALSDALRHLLNTNMCVRPTSTALNRPSVLA